ncbi:MAG: tetratricopeptide repeat protein [Syntrophobacteraceae bacterium]
MKYRYLLCFMILSIAVIFLPLLSSAQGTPGAPADESAYEAMRTGRFQEAFPLMEQAVAGSPGNLELQYNLGVIYFNLGRLDEAEIIFQVLLRQDEGEFRKACFDLAAIALKKGKRVEAIDFLEKARPVDPGRSDLEIGLVYLDLKDYNKAIDSFRRARSQRADLTIPATIHEAAALSQLKKSDEAKKLLEPLLKLQLTPEDRQSVNNMLAGLKAAERMEKRWRLSGISGFMYDTNVLLNPLVPSLVGNPTDEADFAQINSITARYDLYRKDPWVFGASYNHFNMTYFEHADASIIASRPSLYGYWNSPPFFMGMEYIYGKYWAGDAPSADVHSLNPVLAMSMGEKWRTEVRAWNDWRDFHNGTPNDQIHGVGVLQYYLMKKGLAHVRAGVLQEFVDTSPKDAGSYQDTQFTAGIQWPVWKDKWFMELAGVYILRDYRFNPGISSTVRRSDDEQDLYVSLRGPLVDNIQIVFTFQRVWNDSNIEQPVGSNIFGDPFNFKRAIFSCMLAFEY